MTAAGGILHEEYHSPLFGKTGGPFKMVQLWVNLPAKDKMAPGGYQGITAADIPTVELPDGAGLGRVIAGETARRARDRRGPSPRSTSGTSGSTAMPT
jgi:redox-sensitive bicupin YhaK (pirin superfamily)